MKTKLRITVIFGTMLVLIASAGVIKAVTGTQDQADKSQLEDIARDYLDFKANFHKFASSEVQKTNVDDVSLKDMIEERTKQIEDFAEKDSDFYKKEAELVANAINSQKTLTQHIEEKIDKESADKSTTLSQGIDSNSGNTRSFGGSVSDVKISSVVIKGDSAQIDLSYLSKAAFGQWQEDHWVMAYPSAVINDHLTFIKKDGNWKISDEIWGFAPGSEP